MKIGIVGLGLIGGSLARQIMRNTTHTVLAYDLSDEALKKGALLNAYHEVLDINSPSIDVDILMIATNPRATLSILDSLTPRLKKGAIVFDCAGVKKDIIKKMVELKELYPDVYFVGGHPMAGREFSGVGHSTATLFEKAYIIMTPVDMDDLPAVAVMKEFFSEMKCEGITMSSYEKHDKIIAYTSQLAHIVSSAYIKNPLSQEHVGYSAGSFRDLTRVAKLNPVMWTELFMANKEYLLDAITDLEKHIAEYKEAIQSGDEEHLKELLMVGTEMKESADKKARQK
ncbi:MAG: prephenate dehydrogenase/arogenate dehydrogenase family protein [Clostridia bacterium]|nr:prephenate dehydrogenase/arogenate dehydrogenase family protein [Clostridia bacterium]